MSDEKPPTLIDVIYDAMAKRPPLFRQARTHLGRDYQAIIWHAALSLQKGDDPGVCGCDACRRQDEVLARIEAGEDAS